MSWVDFKTYLSDVADLPKDVLHVYAALLVQVAGALLLRRPLTSFQPWAFVFLLLLANEVIDLVSPHRPIEEWQVTGGLRDLWNTMVLPTAILLLARYAPQLFCDGRGQLNSLGANGDERSQP